jgi:CheY-like chemotaxis protein
LTMARILIVDDEKSIREALVQVFEYEGHDVVGAGDGPEALKIAAELRPDVVFLDVKMPGMDGLDVLAKLREEEPQLLVVMISGHAQGRLRLSREAARHRSAPRHPQAGPRAPRPRRQRGSAAQ